MTPTYTQLFEEIGTQIKLRKRSLFNRTFLISWPFIVFAIIIFLIRQFNPNVRVEEILFSQTYLLASIGYIICAFLYGMIISFIFEIEKRIWIDSYFDKKELNPKESWSIAKKLFWPAFKLRLYIAIRYYLPATIILLIVAVLAIFALSTQTLILAIILPVCMLIYGIYLYALGIRLRYTWFVFLDTYNPTTFSFKEVCTTINTLNTISKSESFKKALVVQIGTDSVQVITQTAIGALQVGLTAAGAGGELLGSVVKIYGNELARQVTSFANISAMYVLYRVARKETYGGEQTENAFVYSLK